MPIRLPAARLRSRLLRLPNAGVVLIGAGASAEAGCPLMRDFMDRGRDFPRLGLFDDEEQRDSRSALHLYDVLRARLVTTEEDVENIETLLSLVDLSQNLSTPPIPELAAEGAPSQLRRFVDAVITKSAEVSDPTHPDWLTSRLQGCAQYATLVRALAVLGGRVLIVSLNYDCLIEYTCHCLGIPFSYVHTQPSAITILKLHGSSNWLQCRNAECPERDRVTIAPLEFAAHARSQRAGYVRPKNRLCPSCRLQRTPVIVPPTWSKDLRNPRLAQVWSDAAIALQEAEVLVSIGFSLPVSDAHVRQLLHLGLASRNLRQALAVVGSDEEAAMRWESFFRPSWRDARLDVRQEPFHAALAPAVMPVLGLDQSTVTSEIQASTLLPLSIDRSPTQRSMAELESILRKHEHPDTARLLADYPSWVSAAMHLRDPDLQASDTVLQKAGLLDEYGLAWQPREEILPTHGASFDV